MVDINLQFHQLEVNKKTEIARQIASHLTSDLADVHEVSPFPYLLNSLAKKVDKAFGKYKETTLMQKIKTADERRDNAQRSMIYQLVSLALRQDLPEIQTAARELHNRAFPEDMDYLVHGHEEESQTITRILDTLEQSELQTLVHLTDLQSYIDFARTTQEKFLDVQTQQKDFYQEFKDLDAQKESVIALENGLYAIITMLATIYPLKDDAVKSSIKNLLQTINTEVITQ